MLKKTVLLFGLALVYLFTVINVCFAGDGITNSSKVFGAKPIGLANSYTAMSGDINSIYYNPAGIASITKRVLSTFYSNPYNLNWYKQYNISIALPFKNIVHAISYSANDINYDNFNYLDDLDWNDNTLRYTVGLKLNTVSSLGLNLSYNQISNNLGEEADGWGLDIGYLAELRKDFAFGISLNNLYSRKKWDTGKSEDDDLEYRFGVSYKPLDKLNLLMDFTGTEEETSKTISFGAEYVVWETVKVNRNFNESRYFQQSVDNVFPTDMSFLLRGGLEKDLYNDKDMRYTLGMSFGAGITKVDYAIKYGKEDLEKVSHYFSLNIELGNDISAVEENEKIVENVDLPPLPDNTTNQRYKLNVAFTSFADIDSNYELSYLKQDIPNNAIKILNKDICNVVSKNEVDEMVSLGNFDLANLNSENAAQIGILVNSDFVVSGYYTIKNQRQISVFYNIYHTDSKKVLYSGVLKGTVSQTVQFAEKIRDKIETIVKNYK